MARCDMSDMEWQIIEGLLPAERGRKCRPAHDNRRYLNGMLYVLRIGCSWRDMHERYGNWNSVYVRFRRWEEQGVWDGLLKTLVELGLTDDWQHMLDSPMAGANSRAAGATGGRLRERLVDHAATLRQKSTPVQTIEDPLLVSSSQAVRSRTTLANGADWAGKTGPV